MALTFSQTAAATQLAALAMLLDEGYLRIYGGDRPNSPDTPVSDQVMLAELRFNRPAFSVDASGMLKANPITPEKSARADGQVEWYRAYTRDGKTPVIDGSVGTEDADMIVPRQDIQQTASFSVNDYRLRVPGRISI